LFSTLDRDIIGAQVHQLVLREQTSPSPWFGLLYGGVMRDVIAAIRALVERYVGGERPESEWAIAAHGVFTQTIAFQITREALLRALGVESLTDGHREAILRSVVGNIEACLKRLAAQSPLAAAPETPGGAASPKPASPKPAAPLRPERPMRPAKAAREPFGAKPANRGQAPGAAKPPMASKSPKAPVLSAAPALNPSKKGKP
jgi:hypothetical protein